MILLVLIILAVTIFYYFLKSNYTYWQKRGIRGPKPTLFVGNLGKSFMMKTSPGEIYTEIYNQFPNEEVVGIYRATTPVLLIRDPDVIKEVTVKSFNHFRDNDIDVDKKHDPLFGRHPFVLKGDEWKMVRAQLTPGFTSGKMKWLYPLLEEVSTNLVKFIDTRPEAMNGDGFEAKELCTRFTLNNVASCAFGLEGKCFEEENSDFRQLAKDFFSPDSWTIFAMFLITIFPPITKLIYFSFTSKKVEKKLIDIITQTLKYREENNIIRNDFLHIMSQLKKTCTDYEFTDMDVTAHAAGFFGDGYETSSIVMSFTLFELARNPNAQKKLREEINAAFEKDNGKITYELLQSLPYLEAAINETLRIHPAVFMLQKMCTKTFTYTPKNDHKPVTIEEGTPLILPVHGLHRDSKYYEEPKKFVPERFLPENKDNLTKYTFLPFGEGPRACLGQRFGMLQIKAGIAYVIKNYELSVNKKTQLPIKYQVTNILAYPIGGLWLDFKKIT